jgi:pimeloyl-ACP methyl ester carboxylesterase
LPIGRRDAIAARMHAVALHFDALIGESPGQAELARLRMPMLFMTGARTVAATRRLSELLRHALPRARHVVLQGMGHMGPITHAAEVNGRIVQFLYAHALSDPAPVPSGVPA